MRVALLAGGRSSEHDVSLRSGASVHDGLCAAGHEVISVVLERDGTWIHEGEQVTLCPGRGLLDADVAFPVLHGPFGEDGTVQGLLELLDVPYVGSGVLGSAVCMDKLVSKDLCARAGLPQVAYAAVREGEDHDVAALGLPVFVKPARLGSSVGIAKVSRADELPGALRHAFAHDPRVIVEAMGRGAEVECSILGDDVSEPGEIVIQGDWYDHEAKYAPGGMELVVPARIPAAARERLRALALDAFHLLDCSGLARVDFFVDGDDVLLNEVNTMPGFTETSVYAKLWAATGVCYPQLIDRLCAIAVERHVRERAYRH